MRPPAPDPERRARRHRLNDAQAAEVELAKREVREGKIATADEMDEVWDELIE